MNPAAKAIAARHIQHATACCYWRAPTYSCDCDRPARVAALAADIDAAMVRAAQAALDAVSNALDIRDGCFQADHSIEDSISPAAIVAALEAQDGK